MSFYPCVKTTATTNKALLHPKEFPNAYLLMARYLSSKINSWPEIVDTIPEIADSLKRRLSKLYPTSSPNPCAPSGQTSPGWSWERSWWAASY